MTPMGRLATAISCGILLAMGGVLFFAGLFVYLLQVLVGSVGL